MILRGSGSVVHPLARPQSAGATALASNKVQDG
jgi:hypothetical protein